MDDVLSLQTAVKRLRGQPAREARFLLTFPKSERRAANGNEVIRLDTAIHLDEHIHHANLATALDGLGFCYGISRISGRWKSGSTGYPPV
jgi:hypothetical protein